MRRGAQLLLVPGRRPVTAPWLQVLGARSLENAVATAWANDAGGGMGGSALLGLPQYPSDPLHSGRRRRRVDQRDGNAGRAARAHQCGATLSAVPSMYQPMCGFQPPKRAAVWGRGFNLSVAVAQMAAAASVSANLLSVEG